MEIREAALSPEVARVLMELSAAWAEENICPGYGTNDYEDLAGNRIFLAEEQNEVVGYLFGHQLRAEKSNSVMAEGTGYFEVEELYVKPSHRSRGVGSALFRHLEAQIAPKLDYVLLTAATKNHRALLHFYIDELGMGFWSARLYKKLSDDQEHIW